WESAWRASGSTALGLVPGNYPVDYLPRPGFSRPPPDTNVVTPDAIESVTNFYSYEGEPQRGSLMVRLLPLEVTSGTNRGQWRLADEIDSAWADSGVVLSNLPAGSHLVEFKAVTGFVTPASRQVSVSAGTSAGYVATYLLAEPSPEVNPVEV